MLEIRKTLDITHVKLDNLDLLKKTRCTAPCMFHVYLFLNIHLF